MRHDWFDFAVAGYGRSERFALPLHDSHTRGRATAIQIEQNDYKKHRKPKQKPHPSAQCSHARLTLLFPPDEGESKAKL
jgi:hypothetical protein